MAGWSRNTRRRITSTRLSTRLRRQRLHRMGLHLDAARGIIRASCQEAGDRFVKELATAKHKNPAPAMRERRPPTIAAVARASITFLLSKLA